MKKRYLAAALAALMLCGCSQDRAGTIPTSAPTAAVTQPAATEPAVTEPAVPENTRPLRDERTFYAEGDAYQVPATLYREEDFSIYIPDGQWELVAPGHWVYPYNTEISFHIDRYEGMDGFQLTQELFRQGYTSYGGPRLFRTVDGIYETVTILEADGHLVTFCTEYPESVEFMEGAGQNLDQICDTFLWEIYG